MNIPPLTNAQPCGESRRTAPEQAQAAGASFQDQLAQTSAGAAKQTRAAEAPQASAPYDYSAFMKNDLLSSLSDFRTSLLSRMKEAKEKEEEQEAWDKLMKYLDAWIESLREEGDVRKVARAHAALTAFQSEADSGRPDLGDYLLEQLENLIV